MVSTFTCTNAVTSWGVNGFLPWAQELNVMQKIKNEHALKRYFIIVFVCFLI
jgi:hypothetical protein